MEREKDAAQIALEFARGEAARAEAAAVKGIEAAIAARHESSHVKAVLEKARADEATAQKRAKKAVEDVKRTKAEDLDARKAVTKAKSDLVKAAAATIEAEANAQNAVQAVEVAEKAVALAEIDVGKAVEQIGLIQEVVRVEAGNLKHAKKAAHDTTTRVDETTSAEGLATAQLLEAEQVANSRQEAAARSAKKAYALREELDEATRALETAQAAAEEYEGQGGEWEKRTQKTLKERDSEYKRISAASAKANSAETAADAASDDATERVRVAKEDLATRSQQAENAKVQAAEAAAALSSQTTVTEEAERQASTWIAKHADAEAKLKTARADAAATTVVRLEEFAQQAKETEKNARAEELRAIAAAAAAKEAAERAVLERDSATVAAAEKHANAEKVAEREHEAEAKEVVVEALMTELEDKVHALALATYEARMGATAWWSHDEGEKTAFETRTARQQEASLDIRTLAAAMKTKHLDVSVLDKWVLFKQHTSESHGQADMWNARRLFYGKDGTIISGIPIMVSDIVGSALDRGAPAADLCKVMGDGLTQASIGKEARFTIIACSQHGIRFEDGGDIFTVNIRFHGLGIRMRTKITDNDDGSYTVTYKPTTAGRCNISVLLGNDELPGSPYTCVVCGLAGPAPSSTNTIVSGDALTKVTARAQEHFFVNFRDDLGQVAYASELDVWVQPVGADYKDPNAATGSGSSSEQVGENILSTADSGTSTVAQLLVPAGTFESFVVGPHPLDVTRTADLSSIRIGKLKPGRQLKLGKVEPPNEDGLIRACVRLDVEDLEPEDSGTWRSLWPSQQPWRSLSWRAHRIAEARREDAEAEALAIAMALHQEQVEDAAARRIESAFRGRQGRKQYHKLVKKKEAAIAAAVAAAAAAQMEEDLAAAPPPVVEKTPEKGRNRRGSIGGGRGSGNGKESQAPKVKKDATSPVKVKKDGGAAPAVAPEKKSPSKDNKDNKAKADTSDDGKEGKTVKPDSKAEGKSSTKADSKSEDKAGTKTEGKGEAKGDAKSAGGVGATPTALPKTKDGKNKAKGKRGKGDSEAAKAVRMEEAARAATKIQSIARGRLLRKRLASKEPAPTPSGGVDSPALEQPKGKNRSARNKAGKSGKMRVQVQASPAHIQQPLRKERESYSHSVTPVSPDYSTSLNRHSPPGSNSRVVDTPKLAIKEKKATELFGWVTLAAGNDAFVIKQTGRLPVQMRLQAQSQWMRRTAIDSDRERERAIMRDRNTEMEKMTATVSGNIPHDHHTISLSPRPAYWDELRSDPQRIGFAYGGVFPGRLHAKGQLVEKHEVHFSIGVVGNYLLYVSLRPPHTPNQPGTSPQKSNAPKEDWQVPGSPFLLCVSPGKAYPLTSEIPSAVLPLRGTSSAENSNSEFSCAVVVFSKDKMGNPCDKGGADFTAGFISKGESPRVGQREDDFAASHSEIKGGGLPTMDASRKATVTDVGNGSYKVVWVSQRPGLFDVYVKLDGLHIIGSPTKLMLADAVPRVGNPAPNGRRGTVMPST